MAIGNKKEQEREELHRTIWAIADELRGAVDGWDFKNYVLGTMFYRYISENLTAYINSGEEAAGNSDFDYAKMPDKEVEEAREGLVEEKGFFILPSELFCNVRAKADRGEIWKYPNGADMLLNEKLEEVFRHIEESAKGSISESSFAGLFDDFDVNSNKLGSTVNKRNERLTKLLNGVAAMNLGSVKDHEIDAFGDAYEYLMTMYASNAGKSGGEFFTPADVSVLLTRLGTVGKKKINKVYDPACGSGSLLLKVEKILGKDAVQNGFFGQEINITTYNLCRINMFLHDIGFDKFDIECEDTLINPQHWDDEPFELIVSNPPYSIKWDGDDNPLLINDPRFASAGVLAPKSKADFAFIMHSLSWLASNGTAAIVCFPGIMSRPGVEQKIRKYIVSNNYLDCVIQLPENLFYGTPVATCIMVLKKGKTNNDVLFIDASKKFTKAGANNRLDDDHIQEIMDLYINRGTKEGESYAATFEEISENRFNISVGTYVKKPANNLDIDIVQLNNMLGDMYQKELDLRKKILYSIANLNIENMSESLCPDGVEYSPIKTVCTVLTAPKKLKTNAYQEEGEYPIIDQGQKLIVGYTDDEDAVIEAGEYVIFGDHTREIKYIDFAFVQGADGVKILKAKDNVILPRYLYYCLCNSDIPNRGYNRHWSIVQDIKIPIPSMEVQKKIIETLDHFTMLTDTMHQEIDQQKYQYEYYRKKVLSFKEA